MINFSRFVWRRFNHDNCFYRASALAYTTLLALVPLFAVMLAILAAFPFFNDASEQIQIYIFKNFVPASGEIIYANMREFISHTANLSVVGSISLIVTLILLLNTIEQALNTIWRVRVARRGIFSFFLYWGIIILAPLLLAAGFIVSSYILTVPLIAYTAKFLYIDKWLLMATPFLLSAIAFSLLYLIMPNCKVSVIHALTGGIIAAILFELAKQGFILYVKFFPSYQLLYDALAAIPLFLVWLYISWLVVLFGAEISHALAFFNKEEKT